MFTVVFFLAVVLISGFSIQILIFLWFHLFWTSGAWSACFCQFLYDTVNFFLERVLISSFSTWNWGLCAGILSLCCAEDDSINVLLLLIFCCVGIWFLGFSFFRRFIWLYVVHWWLRPLEHTFISFGTSVVCLQPLDAWDASYGFCPHLFMKRYFLFFLYLYFFSFCFIIIIIFLILVVFLYGTEEKIWSSYDIFFLPRSFGGSSDRICYWVRSEVYFCFFLMDFGANFNELCIIHLFLLWLILTHPLNTPYQLIYKWIGEILMNFLLWD